MTRKVAFLFLGETLLIPHLYPIVEALAAAEPDLPIDLWVSTSMHEALLGGWSSALPNVRIRRAPGFRDLAGYDDGRNPPLPAKLPMLIRLLPYLARVPVIVSAEQTSLWLPAILPLRSRFVNTLHGAGSMMNRDDRRRRAAWRTLVAADRERRALADHGVDPATIAVTGYVKAGFRQRTHATVAFPQARPVLLYAPHWQQHRSSWREWGSDVLAQLAAQDRYNVIFAPHQRLVERVPGIRAIADAFAAHPHCHVDLDSFAMVDGSYTAAADVYLGDTSSQVNEFLMRPRPCLFLNAQGAAWAGDPSYAMWDCGPVVTRIDDLTAAIDAACATHADFAEAQRAFVAESMGAIDGSAPAHAARAIVEALRR